MASFLETRQACIVRVEGTLLATPPTNLHPSPQAILATMRGSHSETEGRAVLFKQVAIKADGGHSGDEDSEERVARSRTGVMKHATKPPPRPGKLAHSIPAPGLPPAKSKHG
ncbi:hypothetical protein BKA70DRAFT_1228145 [Coprinopsis sp. MPI-PUGE-AT-0042]|nr:hypothetical protein BKA70DRAFT_1228145 [Coprinopsis sp. MPI-PUGE-AT-0042]